MFDARLEGRESRFSMDAAVNAPPASRQSPGEHCGGRLDVVFRVPVPWRLRLFGGGTSRNDRGQEDKKGRSPRFLISRGFGGLYPDRGAGGEVGGS